MKKEIDILHGSLPVGIMRFAFPLAATGILQQLFNAADVAVVGQFAGKEAMAAVGSNSPLVGLLVNLFIGISLGTTVVIANAIGRKDEEDVHKAVHTSILVAVIGGILMAIIGEILAEPVIGMLSVPDEVFDMAVLYFRVYLLGLPVIVLYNFEAAIFRSRGDTKTPLIALVISGVVNVGLNLFFVVVVGMTVEGVALATAIANGISSVYLLVALVKTDKVIRVRKEEFRIDVDVLKRILMLGVPAGVQGMVFSIANIVVQSAVNSLGTVVMAASSAAFNIEIFAYYVINAFGQGCTTFVGQNTGAGNRVRCRQSLKWSLLLCMIFSAAFICIILFAGRWLLSLFNGDTEIIETGYLRIQIIYFAYGFSVFQEVLSGYLRGRGVSLLPAACSVVGICGTRIFWVYTIFQAHHTFRVLLYCYPVSLAMTALFIFIATLVYEKRAMKRERE